MHQYLYSVLPRPFVRPCVTRDNNWGEETLVLIEQLLCNLRLAKDLNILATM